MNKTESAVRILHLPTGLTASAQEERSQQRNRQLALSRLSRKLSDRNRENQKACQQNRWQAHNTLERGNPVRVCTGSLNG